MKIIPAIDIREGRAVRLTYGDYDQEKQYGQTPEAFANRWVAAGAECLHLVDLDAAKAGCLVNTEVIRRIRETVSVEIEYGGGIRSFKDAETMLELGMDRIILGTAAFDKDLLHDLLQRFGERIAVGVDQKDGCVRVGGWLQKTDAEPVTFCRRLEEAGVKTVILTDISRDGALEGTNVPFIESVLQATSLDVIASGGVSSLEDIHRLVTISNDHLYGAIVGKALYENKLPLAEAIRLTQGRGVKDEPREFE